MTVARGVRPPDLDLATVTDPYRHLGYLRGCVDAIRVALVAMDERSTWREELAADPRVRELVLDHIAVAGETLATLTVLIEQTDPDNHRRQLDVEHAENVTVLADIQAAIARRRAT